MKGEQLRRARVGADLGQATLAERTGLARSIIQKAEGGGKITVATLETLIVNLPTLKTLTLGGVEFHALSRMTDEELRTVLSAGAQTASAGATRFDHDDVDAATRRRIAALDAAVDRGELRPDSKNRDS